MKSTITSFSNLKNVFMKALGPPNSLHFSDFSKLLICVLFSIHGSFAVGNVYLMANIPSVNSVTKFKTIEWMHPNSFVDPVHNLTQNTFHLTIQGAVNAANPNDAIECSPATYNERVTIDKSLTLQGTDSITCILDGTGLVGDSNGITINNGITNVTIKN
ncbi:MAG: hypothetical protein IPL31_16435 [Saprospiraceae bacterium]|nr:hypothetical protein [Saprospiraceae bacterium]